MKKVSKKENIHKILVDIKSFFETINQTPIIR